MSAFGRKVFKTSLPLAMQCLMLALVAASDAFMLGRIDQDSMSAVSLASQVQFVQNMIVLSLAGGISILGAQYWGKKDGEAIGMAFRIGLRSVICVSALVVAACELAPEWLMKAFAGPRELIEIGARYLRIAGWSYLLTGISQCYHALLRVTGRPGRSAAVSAGTVLFNIVLNAVLVFGLFGAPRMGAEGAAAATLAARACELFWCCAEARRGGRVRPQPHRILESYPALSADFRRCVLPVLGASALWGVGFASYTAVLGHMNADAAAANAVVSVVRDLLCCAADGVAAAAGIIVGNELGAARLETGREYGRRLAVLSVLLGAGCALAVLALIPLLTRCVVLTDAARGHLAGMMCILSLYQIGRYVNTIVINGVFSAGGDTLFDMYSLVVMTWGLAVPLAFLGAFVFRWPVLLVYACTCVDEVGKLPWVRAHYRRHLWVRNLTR